MSSRLPSDRRVGSSPMMHEALRRTPAPSANRRLDGMHPTDRPRPPRPTRPKRRWAVTVGCLLLVAGGAGVFAWDVRMDLDATMARTDAYLDAQESALRSIAPLSDREVALLRRSRNAEHVRLAEALGITPLADRFALDVTVFETGQLSDSLVALRTGDRLLVSRMRYGVPYVTPGAAAALDSIVVRFGERLAALDVPPVRLVLTSALRTTEDQRRLAGVNTNAARGRSSHEYATTFDLTYARFGRAPVPDALPGTLLPDRAWLHRFVGPLVWGRIAERWATTTRLHADRYAAELGRALIALEDAAVLVVVRERRQPVYHVTVARRLTPG